MTRKDIQNLLDDMHLTYSVDEDGDLRIPFDADSDYGYKVTIYVIIGNDGDLIEMLAHSAQSFHKKDFGELIVFCNEWNSEKLWPKTYVYTLQDSGNPDVRCGLSMDGFNHSVSDDFVKEFIKTMISTSWNFYKNLGKQFK